MIVNPTIIEGCFIIQPQLFKDERGYFYESFNQAKFEELTHLSVNFIQDNESSSSKGVLRGLHFQKGEFAQAKLVRVVKGAVQDVVVDVRPSSKTYGQHFSIELSEENKTQLFIPRGLAHGFLVLENDTIFNYKCDNYYNKEAESGIIYNDTSLAIDWNASGKDLIISEKDLLLPQFKEVES
jgi:dTDP-4-dehydrorhamnose 3,5-epimerase